MSVNQNAGYQVGRISSPREVLANAEFKLEVAGVMASTAIDGSNTGFTDRIRGGWLLGQNTSTKQWFPMKRALASGAGTSVNVVTVFNAAAFAVGDAIDIGATTNRTITAINYGTNVITFNGAAINVSVADVVAARDGTQNARGILLDDEVELRDYENRTAVTKPIRILIAGFVNAGAILGDRTSVAGDTSALLGMIRFTDQYL